jgi:hypothetical protein
MSLADCLPSIVPAEATPGPGGVDGATSDAAGDATPDALEAAGRDVASCNRGQLAVCGRGAAGIDCAISNGLASFGPLVTWQTDFGDGALWNSSPSYYGTIQFPDVDGDGKADVCGRGNAGIDCAPSNGAAFGTFGTWQSEFSDAQSWGTSPAYWATIRFPDIDGDGKADVCGRGAAGIECAVSTGQAFGAKTVWQADFSDAQSWGSSPAYWATIQFPDVNGDGKADVCGRGTAGIRCALSDGASFGTSSTWQSDFSDAAQWRGSPSYYATIEFPDVNGDGKADVCGRGAAGVRCAVSDGTSFGTSSTWQTDFSDAESWGSSSSYWATIQFPDVNGDGKADVCGRGFAGIRCALSDGTSFGASSTWQADFSDAAQWNGSPSYYATIQFPDVNGDGKADVCGRGAAGVDCALSDGSASFGTMNTWQSAFSDPPDDAGVVGDAGGPSWGSEAYFATIQFPLIALGDCASRYGRTPTLRFEQRIGD